MVEGNTPNSPHPLKKWNLVEGNKLIGGIWWNGGRKARNTGRPQKGGMMVDMTVEGEGDWKNGQLRRCEVGPDVVMRSQEFI